MRDPSWTLPGLWRAAARGGLPAQAPRVRFAIIGPLLAAPPAAGGLHEALHALAAQRWRHPFTGLELRFGCSTLERWYYAAKKAADPVPALRNQVRGDLGCFPSLSAAAVQALITQYREHPGWTAQLHHDNLRVTLAATGTKCPSYASVRRYLKAHGLRRQRPLRRVSEGALAARDRLEQREVRSYEVEHVLQLMHLDFHHGSRQILTRRGEYRKPLLVGFIDDRSRLLCHAQWYTREGTEQLVHGLCQALQKVGLPRSLMTDRGAAMLAGEFTAGLHRLGILHLPTLPYSPHVNGKQENLWGRVEGRLLAMLEGEANLTLEQLNGATQAWITQEYHRTVHSELGATLYVPPQIENFCWRIEQAHLREGGFALIHGDPGSGKSVAMRLLAERLSRLPDLSVGVIHHPQSNLSDFYRELGDIFGIAMRMSNRWGGFKALRARWLDHLGAANRRPVILIDEAQEMTPMVLSELRLLASARFDSQALLCVVLAGDARLLDKLRREELIPLGSRLRTRLATGVASREELLACLEHLLATAGNASLMTKELRQTLCDHAAGNYRILLGLAAELLMTAAQRQLSVLDEKLYLQVFAQPQAQTPRRAGAR